MKTILASVDFSSATPHVVTAAATLARAVDGRVVLLNVTPPPPIVADPGGFGLEVVQASESATNVAIRELERLEEAIEEDNVRCDVIHQTGVPMILILEQARKLDAAYIVLGSHGHTALYELIVGGTAAAILRHASCPVLIVPPPSRPKSGVGKSASRRRAVSVRL